MPFQVGQGPSADNGEAAVKSAAKSIEQRPQVWRHANRVRSLGQIDKGSVEIEEQGRAVEQVRRRCIEPCHGARWQSRRRIASQLRVFVESATSDFRKR